MTYRTFRKIGLGLIVAGGLTLAGAGLAAGYAETNGYMKSNDLTDPVALSVAGLSVAGFFVYYAGLNIHLDNRYRGQN